MQKKTLWSAGVLTGMAITSVAIACLAFVPAQVGSDSGDDVLGGKPPVISTLHQAVSADDALPPSILELPVADQFSKANAAQNVGTFANKTYYLVPGIGDAVCLIFVGPALKTDVTPESGGTCAPLATSTTAGIYLIGDDGSGTYTVAIVAPDGITSVTAGGASHKVTNNVAVFATDAPSALQFTNDTLRVSTTIDTGPQRPSNFVSSE